MQISIWINKRCLEVAMTRKRPEESVQQFASRIVREQLDDTEENAGRR